MNPKTSRRLFLRTSALLSLTSVLKFDDVSATEIAGTAALPQADIKKDMVILFQGDSITDGNRGRSKDPNHILGHGYAFAVAARVGADFAEANITFYNRGISGNRVPDLKRRWQTDTLDLKPDVLSVLIGINDTSVLINKSVVEDADIDQFENTYRDILNQSKLQNPDTLFVLCLPFVYQVAKVKDKWEAYKSTVARVTERVKKLAKEFNAVTVDFPAVFDKAQKRAPIEYWMWDGIHPTVPGHEIMAREWIKQVSTRLKFLKAYKYK